MSAFVQSTDHIDLLVTAALDFDASYVCVPDESQPYGYRRIDVNYQTADAIGKMLLAENVKSVCTRYGEGIDPEEYAEYAEQIESYRFRRVNLHGYKVPPAALVLKAVDGFDYQACEHDGWRTSDAKAVLDRIQSAAVSRVAGYAEAESWSFSR